MKKNRLAIFDFDGTLAMTPLKPDYKKGWRSWNGKDWWASQASLLPSSEGGFFDDGLINNVADAFISCREDKTTRTVILTGRRSPIAWMVRKVLRSYGFMGKRVIDATKTFEAQKFLENCEKGIDVDCCDDCGHEEFFTGDIEVTNGIPGTFGHKRQVMDRLVRESGGYEHVEIWDDRTDHMDLFLKLGKELMESNLIQKFTFHRVITPKFSGVDAAIINIPVDQNTSWKTHG